MFKQNNATTDPGLATAAITPQALLRVTLALAATLALSIAFLLSSAAAALGARPARAGESAFASSASVRFGVTPLDEPAPPEVYSVEPSVGPTSGGTTVKIKGADFVKGSTVTIGVAATNVEVKSATEIVAKTAADSAGEDEVVVTHEAQSSSEGPSFTYEVLPHVESVTPAEGSTAGGTEVVIKGTGFLTGSSVTIGSKATSVTRVSETELKATTAAGTAGKDEVIVVDKRGASSGGPSFTYISPPTVTSISPAEGSTAGGTAVTVKGTGFSKAVTMSVEVDGVAATEVSVVSATELKAKTAAGSAGKGAVVVSDEFGSSGSTVDFTYVAPPTVSTVEPSVGPTTGGTAVVIKGTGFLKGSTVTIGSAATNVEVKSETEIKAKTAAGTAGKDEVVVTDVGGASTSNPKFEYVTPPTVTSIAPAEGSTAGGTEVVITGTGFVSGSTVTIGAAATGVEVKSETEIKAKTAAGTAGKDKVVVTLPDGVPSASTTEFTYISPPTVTSISPAEGSTEGETVVKIKGTGFIKGATVNIGVAVTAAIVVSPTEIVAETAAESAGKYPVVVADKFGTANGPAEFTYVTPESPGFDAADVGAAAPDVVTPAGVGAAAVTSPAATAPAASHAVLRLKAIVSDGQVHVHVTPVAGRTGRVLVTLRLVHGKQILALLTHSVTIAGTTPLTFTLKLPSAASAAASVLRASAAYVGSPSLTSRTVKIALARKSD